MPIDIKAIYKNGSLCPLSPLDLPENEVVRIVVLPEKQTGKTTDTADDIIRLMAQSGLVRSFGAMDGSQPPDPVSEKERRDIADILGRTPGPPLSEIITGESVLYDF